MNEKYLEQKPIKKAHDELEDINESVNLEAINSLHRIARDSENFRQNIFDHLCLYIRKTTSGEDYQAQERPIFKIQSILNLLVNDEFERVIYIELPADLHGCQLQRAILGRAELRGANLSQSNLRGQTSGGRTSGGLT